MPNSSGLRYAAAGFRLHEDLPAYNRKRPTNSEERNTGRKGDNTSNNGGCYCPCMKK
jgi:hypothetical protein